MEEDDVVDYLIYEDLKKEGFLQNKGRGGCLGLCSDAYFRDLVDFFRSGNLCFAVR